MPRRTRALPALASPCSRRFAPLSSGEPVRPAPGSGPWPGPRTGSARHRFAVTQWPREHLIDQHISRFDADADDPSQVPYHGVWFGLGLLLQSFLTSPLDLLDLADDEAQARHIALQLARDIRRQRRALRRVQCCNTLRGLAQGWFEIANAQPGEGPLHSVDVRVRSLTRHSRSGLGRLASSSAIVGMRAMVQWPRSPRSHPKNPRFSNSVSSRSVFARRCSRDTATLEGWITCASTPCARSQRANQKPSRPASKASAIRVILRPALTASSRQRCSRPSSLSALGSSFLRGWRLMPGSIPATSQLDWLISTTAMIVLSWSRATRDLLKSFGWGIGALHRLTQRRWCHLLAACPIASLGPISHKAVLKQDRSPLCNAR